MRILIIQNRMGIGDMVIFLPFVEAISKNFGIPVSLLVKESTKANHYLKYNKFVKEIKFLKRSNNTKGEHDGIRGFFQLKNELKKENFDVVFIFNSSLRYYLICKLAKIKKIYQYPLFKKKKQHLVNAAKKLLLDKLNLQVNSDPKIEINNESIKDARNFYNFESKKLNILLGIGGSGPTKRIPAKIFNEFISLCLKKYDCNFFLATGLKNDEQIILREIKEKYGNICTPLDKLSISETLPVIKNCNISICNDSSFSHISAGLEIPTIVLMSDTPLMYGSYNSKMHPIIPDGVEVVTHGTQGKNHINPKKIFEKFEEILN